MMNFLRGRLFGHPVHPMLVHFPTALFTAGFLFSLAGYLFSDAGLVTAAFYSIGFGLVAGLAAAQRPAVICHDSIHRHIYY